MSNVAAHLAAALVFERVPRPAVIASAPLWSLKNLVDGQTFCAAGDPGDSVALLVAGEAKAEVDGAEIGRIKLGELVGEASAFFPDGTRSATVTAVGRTTFLVLSGTGLRRLRADRSPVYTALLDRALQELARRVQRTNDRLTRLVEGSHERPVRKDPSALVRLWKSLVPGKPTKPCPSLEPLLRKLPGLGKAPPEALAPLRDAFAARAFAEGEILFLEGEPADSAWMLADGKVDVLRQVRGTRAERLATLSAGDLFGVNALVAKSARTASCVAITPGYVYRLPSEASAGLKGEALLWWSECVLAVMQAQLRLASGTLGQAITGKPRATEAGAAAAPVKELTPEEKLQSLLEQSGFLEGLPQGLDLDDIEVVVDEDQLRNPRRR